MNKFVPLAILATVTTFAVAPAALHASDASATTSIAGVSAPLRVVEGAMIYGTDGRRVAPAYRVTANGTVLVILNGKLVTVPAASLSEVDGKVVTSLSKADLRRAR